MAKATCKVEDCGRAVLSREMCGLHYQRQWRLGSVDLPIRLSEEQRFWSKVDKTRGCWLWVGTVASSGYGIFMGADRRTRSAHRFSYRLLVGPIPDGLELDHLCRVRRCVRPAHLDPVTRKTNILRGVGASAMNARKTHCLRGHPLSGANLYIRPHGGRECRTCMRVLRVRREAKR